MLSAASVCIWRAFKWGGDTDAGAGPEENHPSDRVTMERMGSRENWLACHLIAHLALHEFFVSAGRPVSTMPILDQPAQIYYPLERDVQGSLEGLSKEDREAVRTIFRFNSELRGQTGSQFPSHRHGSPAQPWGCGPEGAARRLQTKSMLLPSIKNAFAPPHRQNQSYCFNSATISAATARAFSIAPGSKLIAPTRACPPPP
jgi:uncharacterized protein DUF3732